MYFVKTALNLLLNFIQLQIDWLLLLLNYLSFGKLSVLRLSDVIYLQGKLIENGLLIPVINFNLFNLCTYALWQGLCVINLILQLRMALSDFI